MFFVRFRYHFRYRFQFRFDFVVKKLNFNWPGLGPEPGQAPTFLLEEWSRPKTAVQRPCDGRPKSVRRLFDSRPTTI